MRIALLLLSGLALATGLSLKCISTLPFLEVCAYGGCFLNINQQDLEVLNCDRELRSLKPLIFYEEGKCSPFAMPKCRTFDF